MCPVSFAATFLVSFAACFVSADDGRIEVLRLEGHSWILHLSAMS